MNIKKSPARFMPQSNNFIAITGSSKNSGFESWKQRLATIQPQHNPYITGESLKPNSAVFVGRKALMHEILSELKRLEPGCVSVLGERRVGKSSLINQVGAALETVDGLITVYVNPQSWQDNYSPDIFFNELLAVLSGKTDENQGWLELKIFAYSV